MIRIVLLNKMLSEQSEWLKKHSPPSKEEMIRFANLVSFRENLIKIFVINENISKEQVAALLTKGMPLQTCFDYVVFQKNEELFVGYTRDKARNDIILMQKMDNPGIKFPNKENTLAIILAKPLKG